MRLEDFLTLSDLGQLQAVAEGACWVAERPGEYRSSIYYLFGDFYVELLFLHHPEPRLVLITFTEKDEHFEELLNALPVDPAELLRAA